MKTSFNKIATVGVLAASLFQFSAFAERGGHFSRTSGSVTDPAPLLDMGIQSTQGGNGEYLTDEQGRSLYVFSSDARGQSNCTGQCAEVWPPLVLPSGQNAIAMGNVNSALLGTLMRNDGSLQVTYNGYPLYYYSADQATGDTKGQGLSSFGANWYLIKPDGMALQPGGTATGGAGYPVYPVYPRHPVYPRRPEHPRGGGTPGTPGTGHSPTPTYTSAPTPGSTSVPSPRSGGHRRPGRPGTVPSPTPSAAPGIEGESGNAG